jgi:hypothetical protein
MPFKGHVPMSAFSGVVRKQDVRTFTAPPVDDSAAVFTPRVDERVDVGFVPPVLLHAGPVLPLLFPIDSPLFAPAVELAVASVLLMIGLS